MSEHLIRASAVAAALHYRNPHGRVLAAMSSHIEAGSCGRSWRGSWSYIGAHLGMSPTPLRSGITLVLPSDLLRVIEKVRTAQGPKEVKKTWGVGYRALIDQIKAEAKA